jgi:hypothetical protein
MAKKLYVFDKKHDEIELKGANRKRRKEKIRKEKRMKIKKERKKERKKKRREVERETSEDNHLNLITR